MKKSNAIAFTETRKKSQIVEDYFDEQLKAYIDDVIDSILMMMECDLAFVKVLHKDIFHSFFKKNIESKIQKILEEESELCSHTMSTKDLVIFEDLIQDMASLKLSYHTQLKECGFTFYAGIPLYVENGDVLGVICVLHSGPKKLCDQQKIILKNFAKQVTHYLELKNTQAKYIKKQFEMDSYIAGVDKYAIIAKTDINGKIKYVNELFCEVTGYTTKEVIGKTHSIINSGYHSDDFFKEMWQTILSGQVWRGEIRNKTKSGMLYWVDTTIVPIKDKHNQISDFMAFRYDITDRKETEFLFREVGKIAKIGGWKLNIHTFESFWTNETYRIHELPIGTPTQLVDGISFYAEHERERISNYVKDCIEKGKPFESDFEFITAKGNKKWVHSKGIPEFDSKGNVIALIGTFQDVTVSYLEKQELKSLHTKLYNLLSFSPVGLVETDKDGNCLYVNDTWLNMAGLDFQEALGKGWQEGLHIDDLKKIFQEMELAFHEDRDFNLHYRLYSKKTRKSSYVHGRSRALKNEKGEITGYLAVVMDQTDEQSLERDLALVLEANRIGIWKYNLLTGELFWDQSMYTLYDLEENDFSGAYDAWSESLHPDYKKVTEEALENAIKGERPFDTIFAILTKSGEKKYIQARAVVERDAQGLAISMTGVNTDVTHEQNALFKAQEATRAKSQFLASMSHEIRTPLNGILGMAQLLESSDLSHEQKEMVHTISKSGDILLELINGILDLSKIESGKMDVEEISFNLFLCIDELIDLHRVKAHEKNNKIYSTKIGELDQWYFGDPTRIKQILINFISNALKFTSGGEIEVTIEEVKSSDPDHDPDSALIRFSVRDEGIGIPDHMKDRLFVDYVQGDASTTRKYGGTGLGLSITSKLSELLNGRVFFESEEGLGSTFYLELRLNKSRAENVIHEENVFDMNRFLEKRGENHEYRIIIAEDNPVNAKIAHMMLKKMGLNAVEFATNGLEVLDLLTKHGPEYFDLILMDVQMPELDGKETTKKIKEIYQERAPQVIALTANAFAQDREECLKAGMSDFLSKPLKLQALKEVIAKVAA